MDEPRIPIFPLNTVLMPRMPLPLHVFEERYRIMISECITAGREFGVVNASGSRLQNVGTTAEIKSVIKEYDDGRLDILSFGAERFRILEVFEDRPYLTAKVSMFGDDTNDDEEALADAVSDAVATLAEFAEVTGTALDIAPLTDIDAEQLSFLIAVTDIFSNDDRQSFIEMTCTVERLEKASEAVRRSTIMRKAVREIRHVVGDSVDITHLFN